MNAALRVVWEMDMCVVVWQRSASLRLVNTTNRYYAATTQRETHFVALLGAHLNAENFYYVRVL